MPTARVTVRDGPGCAAPEHCAWDLHTATVRRRGPCAHRGSPHPGVAKRLGRTVQLRPDWDAIRVGVMRELLTEKFTDPHLASLLVATAPAVLVEGNKLARPVPGAPGAVWAVVESGRTTSGVC
jgi:hypothetical protein